MLDIIVCILDICVKSTGIFHDNNNDYVYYIGHTHMIVPYLYVIHVRVKSGDDNYNSMNVK